MNPFIAVGFVMMILCTTGATADIIEIELTDLDRLREFMAQNTLHEIQYNDNYYSGDVYHCCHFSRDLTRDAKEYFGKNDTIRVYPAIIYYNNGARHAVNAAMIDGEWLFFDGSSRQIYRPQHDWQTYTIGIYLTILNDTRGCRLGGMFVWENV